MPSVPDAPAGSSASFCSLALRSAASKDDDACFDAHAPDHLQISGAGGWRDRRVQCELELEALTAVFGGLRCQAPGQPHHSAGVLPYPPRPSWQPAGLPSAPQAHIATAAAVALRHPGHPQPQRGMPALLSQPQQLTSTPVMIPAEVPHSPWRRREPAQGTVCRHGQQVLRPGDLLLRVW